VSMRPCRFRNEEALFSGPENLFAASPRRVPQGYSASYNSIPQKYHNNQDLLAHTDISLIGRIVVRRMWRPLGPRPEGSEDL
jgi:hypothetical protein